MFKYLQFNVLFDYNLFSKLIVIQVPKHSLLLSNLTILTVS